MEATEEGCNQTYGFESLLYLNGRYKRKNGDKKNGQVYTAKSWQERKVAWPGVMGGNGEECRVHREDTQ